MSQRVPNIDERLRLVLVYLDTLKVPAFTVGRVLTIPQLRSADALAAWVAELADIIAAQVLAIQAVLPAECGSVDAPFVGGGR